MSLDDAYDVLITGSRAQIEELQGSGIGYSYSPSFGGFSIWTKDKKEIIRGCKLFDNPNCAKIYGNEHTF